MTTFPLRFCRLSNGWVLSFLMFAGCHAVLPPGPAAADLVRRGIAESEQHNYAGAIADFERALALVPDDGDVRYNLALAKSESRDYAGAVAEFDRVLRLNPGDAEACLSRGSAKFYQEDYAGAIADYDRAVALDPRYTSAVYARALAKRRLGNFAGAFADYDRAIALDPDYWRAYNGRATAHNAHGDFALAIADYTRRIELAPEGDEYAWFQRSLLRRRLGRTGADGQLAQEVARWPEGWPKVVGQYLLGRLGADELLRRAAEPTDPQTRREQLCEADYYVGITALLAGRGAEAREKFQACVDTGVSAFLEHLLARSELARMAANAADK